MKQIGRFFFNLNDRITEMGKIPGFIIICLIMLTPMLAVFNVENSGGIFLILLLYIMSFTLMRSVYRHGFFDKYRPMPLSDNEIKKKEREKKLKKLL